MGSDSIARITRLFIPTYVAISLGLSVFAFVPARGMQDSSTLLTTVYQMLLLAAVVTPYALAVVFLDGETDSPDEGRGAEA